MFGHDATLESQTGRVEIIDFSPKTISSLLKFVYADEVPYDEINLDLLSASHKYMIRPLFNSCQQYLSVRLKLGNAVQLFTASIMYFWFKPQLSGNCVMKLPSIIYQSSLSFWSFSSKME